MGFIIVVIAIVVIVIAVKSYNGKERDSELDELKEKIHNSDIIKELKEQFEVFLMYTDLNWSYTQTDYYDECERVIEIFNSGIVFGMWKDDDWQAMYSLDFVGDLGYKPLLDNGLKAGKNHLTNEDVYTVFAVEVRDIVKNMLGNKGIEFPYIIKYHSGYESQQQPDGTSRQVKIGDEHASIRYKVPKSVGAKQI